MRERNRGGRGKKGSTAAGNRSPDSARKEELSPAPDTHAPPKAADREPPKKSGEAGPSPSTSNSNTPPADTEKKQATQKSKLPDGTPREPVAPREPTPEGKPHKPGGGCAPTALSLLALLISLGVGGAGYYLWQQLQSGQRQTVHELQQNVASHIDQIGSTLQGNQQQFTALEDEIAALKKELTELEKKHQELRTLQHDTTLQELAALNDRITAIKTALEGATQQLAKLQTEQQEVTGRIDQANSTLEKLAAVEETISALTDKVEQAGKRQEELLKALEGMHLRVNQELDVWKLSESEYLLQVAARRLSLEHDIEGAAAALKAADKSIAEIGDPRWLPVRQSIATALTELQAVPIPDIEGDAMTLASLEKAVDKLPLPQPERHLKSTALDTEALSRSEDLQSWSDKVVDALKKLVVIRRGDNQAVAALLPPEQAVFLRQNLRLKLEGARYSLLRNDPALFRESIKTAQEWVGSNFDTHAAATRAMLETLQKLAETQFPKALPDITAPLQQLRELRNVTAAPPQRTAPDSTAEGAES